MNRRYLKYRSSNSSHRVRNIKKPYDRLKILSVFFIIITAIVIVRLADVQIWQHKWYEALASKNHDFYKDLFPNRGEIYVLDPYTEDGLHKIAMNEDLSVVYANPWQIEDKDRAVEELGPLLGISEEELEKKLEPKKLENDRKDTYEILKRKISGYEKKAIEDLEIKGINFTSEAWRYYPDDSYTAHITGFLGMNESEKVGQYGLEGYFNDELKGTAGYLESEKDAGGRFIAIGDKFVEEANDGDDLYLTIDKNIQFFACDKLAEAVEKHGANKGTVIILEPQTGAVLALCDAPSYDPNEYSDVESLDIYIDSAVADQYEPGSVFKSFALGAALDLGKISPYTTYEDTGAVKIGKYTIKNSDGKAYGVQDMNFVLAESLNTGSIFAVQQAGNEAWYQYVAKFGFGEKTGIELSGEGNGNITSLEEFKDIYAATSSYGQGITVTPIQLITAYNTIANGGNLMKPYIVATRVKANGHQEKTEPQVIRQVISAQTASTLGAMLVNVIDSGHAARAAVDGYFMAGKTGTAQIPKENGVGYDKNRHKDTFIGFGPVSDPKFIILTKIDEPKDVLWSAGSAAPLFGQIAEYLVDYYQIPPDRE